MEEKKKMEQERILEVFSLKYFSHSLFHIVNNYLFSYFSHSAM